MHRIDSALAFVDLCDVVRATPARGLSLTVSGPLAGAVRSLGAANYVLRAASELRERAGITAGAALDLEKHIPPGAGLAGGTADGAAALRALGRLWGVSPRAAAMRAAASALGADGPACLDSRPCWAGGIGADLTPMPAPAGHVVIAWPAIELATARVYARLARAGLPARRPGVAHRCSNTSPAPRTISSARPGSWRQWSAGSGRLWSRCPVPERCG